MIARKRYLTIKEAKIISELGRRCLRLEVQGKEHWIKFWAENKKAESEYIDIDMENALAFGLLPENYDRMKADEQRKEALLYLKGKSVALSCGFPVFDSTKHSEIYKKAAKEREDQLKDIVGHKEKKKSSILKFSSEKKKEEENDEEEEDLK